MAQGQRSLVQSPYHYCGRCSCRTHIDEMTWQQGVLVCKKNDCQDTALLGSRDAAIARALQAAEPDAQPDQKLLNPADISSPVDDILV